MHSVDYDSLSARLKVLAHPERLRILDALRHEPECVCHLEALLGKPQPYVSQQLRLLRNAGVICDEKQAQNVFYRVCDAQVLAWLDAVLGTLDKQAGAQNRHQPVKACNCPKCVPVVISLAA